MAWDGFFQYGGTEIINASRTEAYASHLNAGWFKPIYNQPDLAWLLDDPSYATPLQDDAPWTDPDNLDSYDFLGVYPLEVTGIEDSTVVATVTESVIDGGYIGRTRKGTRAIVFNAVLTGLSSCAVEYGLRWLRNVLNGSPCFGSSYGVCGGADLCYLACVPLIGEPDVTYHPGPLQVTGSNVATNPDFEVGGTDGWTSADATRYVLSASTDAPITGTKSLLSTRQGVATVTATNLAINPISDSGNVTTWWAPARATVAANTGFLRMTITDATVTVTGQRISTPGTAGSRVSVSPGETVRIAAQVRSSGSVRMCLNLQFYDAANTPLPNTLGLPTPTGPTDWTDLAELTAVAPANTAYVIAQVAVYDGARNIGDTFDARHVIITKGTTATPYFDGSTPAAAPISYRWTGAVNASTSERVLTAVTTSTVTQDSLRVTGSTAYACTPGAAVAVGVDVKVEQASRSISGYLSWGGGGVTPTVTIPAGAPGTVVRLVLTGTPPAGATTFVPTITVTSTAGNAVLGERVWFDNLYVGADLSGTYFDGSTPAHGDTSYSWSGAVSASISHRSLQTYLPDTPASADDCYEKVGRSLHKVTVTNGPNVTKKMDLIDGGAVWTVTWTMVAANPAEFGVERPLVVGFLDPAVDIPYYGGVVPEGGAYDENGFVQTETKCPAPVFTPVFDPTCALLVAPPDVPTIVPMCFNFPVNYTRRSFTIPRELIPLWTEVVPVLQVTTKQSESRNVRIRFYADTFNTGNPSNDPCNYCGDLVISYVPPSATLVLNGMDQSVYIDQPGQGRRRADALVTDSTGNPFEWPQFSCGFGYVVTVDTPQQTKALPIVDLSLVPRII